MAKQLHIPLFPLNTVLFPGGILPLRIFEPRYMEMVSVCMKEQSGIGVCLILSGKEVGEAATTNDVGTFVRIIDWDQRDDGMLGITVQGEQRFRVLSSHARPSRRATDAPCRCSATSSNASVARTPSRPRITRTRCG